MPTILIEGFRFRFYSSDRFEPAHVHVIRAENEAKVWLRPVTVESNHGYNGPELNRIVRITEANRTRLLEAWDAYFAEHG